MTKFYKLLPLLLAAAILLIEIPRRREKKKDDERNPAGVHYTCDDVCIVKRKQHFKRYNGA